MVSFDRPIPNASPVPYNPTNTFKAVMPGPDAPPALDRILNRAAFAAALADRRLVPEWLAAWYIGRLADRLEQPRLKGVTGHLPMFGIRRHGNSFEYEVNRPECFGSHPSPQEQAENDCSGCRYRPDCFNAPVPIVFGKPAANFTSIDCKRCGAHVDHLQTAEKHDLCPRCVRETSDTLASADAPEPATAASSACTLNAAI